MNEKKKRKKYLKQNTEWNNRAWQRLFNGKMYFFQFLLLFRSNPFLRLLNVFSCFLRMLFTIWFLYSFGSVLTFYLVFLSLARFAILLFIILFWRIGRVFSSVGAHSCYIAHSANCCDDDEDNALLFCVFFFIFYSFEQRTITIILGQL